MEKLTKFFKNKTLMSVIAAVLIIAAVIIIPKITGKPIGELLGWGGSSQTAEERSAQTETGSQTAQSESQAVASEAAQQAESGGEQNGSEGSAPAANIAEDGSYTSKEDVALYLRTYKKLPRNFITKKQAEELGWEGGDLWRFAPGKSIGGDVFGNREGLLPKKNGRTWYECDVDYAGGKRGAKRIVYSSDGLIYYTDDHYETFTELKRG